MQAEGPGCRHGHVIGYCDSAGVTKSKADARLSLWWAHLDISASALRGLAVCLLPGEWQRADRYYRHRDRRRFLAARGWLRHLLASRLLCTPSQVQIVTDDLGKPRVASSDLCFSAARSGGIALYATSWKMDVGVDIGSIRAAADINGIAARVFARAERQALASLPPSQRREASFRCWTRKRGIREGHRDRTQPPDSCRRRLVGRRTACGGIRLVYSPSRPGYWPRGCRRGGRRWRMDPRDSPQGRRAAFRLVDPPDRY
jgi:4'-phosphopantetheinyl transferase